VALSGFDGLGSPGPVSRISGADLDGARGSPALAARRGPAPCNCSGSRHNSFLFANAVIEGAGRLGLLHELLAQPFRRHAGKVIAAAFAQLLVILRSGRDAEAQRQTLESSQDP
jgi:hypothetical protein